MNFVTDEQGGVKILRISEPRLDTNLAPELKAQILGLLDEGERKIILDLGDVEYADSSGLGAILFGIRMARDVEGQCKLINLNNRVLSLIKIAKLDHVIEAYDDEAEAVSSFSA